MARETNRLTAKQVEKLSEPGFYPDGLGLYLQISPTGSKAWVYRYQKQGRERRHGLGPFPAIKLKEARNAALECQKRRQAGIDPIEFKRQEEAAEALSKNNGVTFKECAEAYIESHKAGWKNKKHADQWTNTLTKYAYPVMEKVAVKDIDVGMVMKVLEPIWYKKTETATRVRQRIENVLDWAKARKYRTGENPALWRGHLDKLLPKPSKVQKVEHFRAMPYQDVPGYFQELRKKDTLAAHLLAFTILTATRIGESRGAKWEEIDLRKKIWTIPAERMKAHKEHRVPLSSEAIAILKKVKPLTRDGFVFPGLRKEKPISEAAALKELQSKHPDLTVHGFRSSFRDWCAEMTNYPREVAEAALAHTLKDKTEAAYQRGDLFEKRNKLMKTWANFTTPPQKQKKAAS